MDRPLMKIEDIDDSLRKLRKAIIKRLGEKGYGSFASTHEIYGVLAEEVGELEDELKANNVDKFADELMDVAVTVVFGHACIKTHELDYR